MRVDKRPKPVRTLVVFLVVGIVVGAAAGLGGAILKGKSYDSVAQLAWDPSSLRYTNANAYVPDSTSLGVQINTQALKVLSDAVVVPAGQTLGMTPQAIRDDVTSTASAATNQLTITATAASAERARAIAAEVVTQYEAQVKATFSQQYTEQAAALEASISKLQLQVDATPSSSSALADNLSAQLATLTTQQIVLKAQAADADIPVSTIREPDATGGPAGPSPATLMIIGGGIGFLIALVLFALVRALGLGQVQQSERADTRPVPASLPAA